MVDVRAPDFPAITAAREAYDAEYLPQVAAQHDDVQPVFSVEDFYEIVDHTTGLRQLITIDSVTAAAGADGGSAGLVSSLIQFRRGTAAAWAAANPVLAAGEPGYETDTKVVRIGDGTSNYLNLSSGVRTTRATGLPLTNNTTAASTDLPGLSFSVQAGHVYYTEFHCFYQSDTTTTGIAFNATTPAATFGGWAVEIQQGGSGTDQYFSQSSGNTYGTTGQSQSVVTINTTYNAFMKGTIQPSADGIIQIRFRTEVEGSTVTVLNGVGRITDFGV